MKLLQKQLNMGMIPAQREKSPSSEDFIASYVFRRPDRTDSALRVNLGVGDHEL